MDISKQNTGELEIVQRSKVDDGSEGDKLHAMESSQGDESSKCQNAHSNSATNESPESDNLKSTSSDSGNPPSFTTRVDKCCSSPLVSVHVQESNVELSCGDQNPNNLEVAAEDLMIVKENGIHTTSSNVNKLMDIAGSGETNNRLVCKIRDGDTAKANLSSTVSDSHLGKDVEQCHYSEDTKQLENIGVTEPVIVHPFEGKQPNGMKDLKCGDDGDVVIGLVNGLIIEESNQMTPPDAEIFDGFVVEGIEADRPDYVMHNRDLQNGSQSNRVNKGNASLDYNTRHEFSSKCRGDLKLRSQARLFKSPGSFSYRRMLPFIMGIANDNCDTRANCQFKKLEKDSKQSSLLIPNDQEISFDKLHIGLEEKQEDDSAALPVISLLPANDQSNDVTSCTEFQMPFNSQKEDPLKVKEVVSYVSSESGRSTDLLNLVQPVRDKGPPLLLLCQTNTEASVEELAMSRAGVRSDCMKSSDTDGLQFTQSPCNYPVSPRNPADGLKRGILKRNPRGCRGLCTCLNCTSFRLHAERAFEFSRNQMEDTEELVLELVTELSNLRKLLEKSADADEHHAINVNQVKEACRKASEVEELAKDHLGHMSNELGAHCRITCLERPRVKFSDSVKEHIVPKLNADFPYNKIS